MRQKAAHFVTLSVANGSEPAGSKGTFSSRSASSPADIRLPRGLELSSHILMSSYSTILGIADCPGGKGVYYFPHKSDPAPKCYSLAVAMALARGRKASKGHCVPPRHREAARLPLVFLHLSTSLLPMQCGVMHRERVTTSNIKNLVNCYMGKKGNKFWPLLYIAAILEE